jgi:ADP-heptose:LPS heptosyltransferase
LIVRLRNWVGDVTLAVPMLQRLDDAGFDLQLVGKRWAGSLLAGHDWPVHSLPSKLGEQVALLRRLRREAGLPSHRPDRQPIDALCLPDSFSSALAFRLAGLRALGHAHEARGWLLARTLPLPRQQHALPVYWAMGEALLGRPAPVPVAIGLKVGAAQRQQAQALRATHGLAADCILICPFAGGTWNQQDKTWPGFADYVAHGLPRHGRRIVVCPGPGAETALAQQHFPGALLLPDVDLGTYAALLEDAALMVSNDTGPGHMAAAVGTPLVSVLGPSDPALWRAWGAGVRLVQGPGGWPSAAAVDEAVAAALALR